MTMERLLADPLGVRGQLKRIYNLARIPALAMPMGFSPGGLPLSLQIAAATGAEADIYAVAGVLDDEMGWTRFRPDLRSEEHTSELQSLMRISYAVFCLKKKNKTIKTHSY